MTADDRPATSRSSNPIGTAFIVYTVAIFVIFAAVLAGIGLGVEVSAQLTSQLGVVASTVFALAGALAAHRSVVARDRRAGLIAAVLLGPGAGWCWLAFVDASPVAGRASDTVIVIANGLAVVLLVEGLRFAHWFGVFSGLGSLALGLTAIGFGSGVLAGNGVSAGNGSAVLALLAGVSGITCLYGLLVDIEVADNRSLTQLVDSRRHIAEEMVRAEEVLHDLRNGLLSIEAAIGSFDHELAAPVRAEATRLRELTVRGVRRAEGFDLVGPIGDLVAARRAAGVDIDIVAPPSAPAWGKESEVVAIVDNLLSNAVRHGRAGPVTIELTVETTAGGEATQVSVSNQGDAPASADADRLFRRGTTTHPDGQGIGLSRARMLAGMNGGELTLAPTAPGWTTFVLSLRPEPSPDAGLAIGTTPD